MFQQLVRDVRELSEPTKGHHVVQYDNLTDLVNSGEITSNRPKTALTSRRRDSEGWFGTATYDDAKQLALGGWADGVQRIVDLSNRVSEKVSRRIQGHGMDLWEEGGEVDIAAYLNGQQACMWTWTEQENKRPIVRVSVNIAVPGMTQADQFTFGGAIVTALVDALEQSGRRVEVDSIATSADPEGGRTKLNIVTNIKRAEQPLDLSVVAYALAHPSMFRRTIFAVREMAPRAWVDKFEARLGGSYGRSEQTPDDLCGDIHVELRKLLGMSIDEAYDWIIDNLREQGVDIK